MVYRGRLEGAVMVFEEGTALPEGMQVRIEPVAPAEKPPAAINHRSLGKCSAPLGSKYPILVTQRLFRRPNGRETSQN